MFEFSVLVHSEGYSIAMSTATHPTEAQPEREFDCADDECDSSRTPSSTVAGSFCSRECAHRHRGRRLLNLLKHDHRYCYTCFRRLKDVHQPTDEWRRTKSESFDIALDQGASFEQGQGGSIVLDATDCGYRKAIDPESVTGFQFGTEHATTGEVRRQRPEGVPDDTRIGLICQCGNTDARVGADIIREADVRGTVLALLEAVETLRDEEQHDKEVHRLRLVRELRRQYRDRGELDFEVAVGAAIQEDTA